ncbi:MAG: D-alanyl-D-alanine carboxypeptidase [Rhodobacteraceae bacterium]|nr:D-alanyl-D-alanine carboxypeptidase [Paracoccaceae bacterium]
MALSASASLAAEGLDTRAPSAFLIETQTGTVLFSKEPSLGFAPGSLTKVMTAAVVFKALSDGETTQDTKCYVSEHAWRSGGAPSGRATMFASIKSEVEVINLLQGLLVHNANDAAIILAECLEGSEAAFAKRMTALAMDLGMRDSFFANPTGYVDDDTNAKSVTTVRDLAILAQYILSNHKDLYKLFGQSDFTWNKIFQRNKSPILGEIRDLDGLGGGQDEEDGYSALASVDRSGRRIIAVVAKLENDKNRLAALREVVEGAWEFFDVQKLYKSGEVITEARVFGGVEGAVGLKAVSDINVLLPRSGNLDYRLRAVYEGPLVAPVAANTVVGEIRVIGRDGIVHTSELATTDDVARGDMQQRALGALWELLFGWF